MIIDLSLETLLAESKSPTAEAPPANEEIGHALDARATTADLLPTFMGAPVGFTTR